MKRRIYVFGNKSYYEAFRDKVDKNRFELLHITDERSDKQNYARNAQDMFEEFEQTYDAQYEIAAFVNLARGSVVGGVEHIAQAWELIKKAHTSSRQSKWFGPSYEAACIFTHKQKMADMFKDFALKAPVTATIPPDAIAETIKRLASDEYPLPAVLKAPDLSGGRGMTLASNWDELKEQAENMANEGHAMLLLSQYVSGLEVSFAVLRLGDTFLHMPPCYKEATDLHLTHPDNKVKMTGRFAYFNEIYEAIEAIMHRYNMHGLLYLEAILQKKKENYDLYFLEGAARISGNSPIEFASLKGFDFYQTLARWIDTGQVSFGFEEQLCIQYASYEHHGQNDVEKLLAKDWVIEAKHEDMGLLPFAKNKQSRIRISFIAKDAATLSRRLAEISTVLDSPTYNKKVLNVIASHKKDHPSLYMQ